MLRRRIIAALRRWRHLWRLRRSGLIDPAWYRHRHPESAGMDPVRHYLLLAPAESDPGPGFSAAAYLAANRDVAAAGLPPLLHYVLDGWAAGRPLRPGRYTPLHLPRLAGLAARENLAQALRQVLPRRRVLRAEPGPDLAATIAVRPDRGAMPTNWCLFGSRGGPASLLVTSGGVAGLVSVPALPRRVLVCLPPVPAALALRREDGAPRPVLELLELGAAAGRVRATLLTGRLALQADAFLPEDVSSYAAWVRRYDRPDERDRAAMAARLARLDPAPVFRVLAETPPAAQLYPHWTMDPAAVAEFEVRIAPGTTLAPHALLLFAEAIAADPAIDALYADEDRLVDGVRCEPWFKPDFGPLLGTAQDLFGAVRVSRRTPPRRVVHIPHVLAHRSGPPAPPRAVPPASVARWPSVTAIVPTRDHAATLAQCLAGLLDGTDYPALDILVADNGSVEADAIALLAAARGRGVAVLPCPGPFNFAAINNAAAAAARGELLLFLNNDVSMADPGWLRAMVRLAVPADVGAVGAKLLYPDGTLQHGGVVLGMGGVAGHVELGAAAEDPGYADRLRVAREVSAVTAACMLVPARHFAAVGGFDAARFAVAFNDVDLCLRLLAAGLRILWTPDAVLTHWESKSRGSDLSPQNRDRFAAEAAAMQARWGEALRRDPYFSPNLSLETPFAACAFPPRVARPWDGS